MKKLLVIVSLTMSFSFFAQAHKKEVLKIKAKNFTCSELQDIVAEENHVYMKGFGGLDIFANKRSCKEHFGSYTKNDRAHFRASDKTFCFVGYRCIIDFPN